MGTRYSGNVSCFAFLDPLLIYHCPVNCCDSLSSIGISNPKGMIFALNLSNSINCGVVPLPNHQNCISLGVASVNEVNYTLYMHLASGTLLVFASLLIASKF